MYEIVEMMFENIMEKKNETLLKKKIVKFSRKPVTYVVEMVELMFAREFGVQLLALEFHYSLFVVVS